MKFKFIAALLGLTMAVPGAVIGQNGGQNDAQYGAQAPSQYSKPSPNIQPNIQPNGQAPAPGPNDQGPMDEDQDSATGQGSMNQGPANQGSANQGSMGQGSMNQSPMDQPPAGGPNDPYSNSANPGLANPGSANPGSANPGSTYPDSNGANAPTYNTPAPVENNGVARISLIHGDVSTQRGDSKDWSAAVLNAPVVAGDRVSTGDKARAELELDYANTLRLAEHTQANVTQLTRSQIQIQLGHGMANYTVYRGSDADAEIDTPNVAIRTERRESSFRILVTADDHTEILVRRGEVEVTTPQGGTRVGQNQFITIQGSGADAQYKIGEAPARDDFDQWNTDRDNMIRNSEARKHTNDYYVGTENLDGHGTWSEVPDYGPVWRPAVPPDWAPYRDGRWVYEPYWGWTWVSYDDWGWAPYHYGRWLYVDGGWGWWPGPAYGYPFYRPIWAPAYVSFFGFGGGFGFGFGFGFGGWGGVGWIPLGPCDRFHPWYGRYGGGYGSVGWGGVNRGGFAPLHGGTRFSNVNLAMHDANFRGATSVSGRDFGTGHMSPHAMSHAEMQNARFNTGRLTATPGRESFSASGRPAAASTTRNVAQNQHFFSAHNSGAMANGRMANGSLNNGWQRSSANVANSANSERASERSSEARNFNSGSASRPGASNSTREGGSNGGWQKFSPMAPRSSSESGRTESGRAGESYGRGSSSSMGQGHGEERGGYGSARNSGPEGRSYGAEGRGYSAPSRGYGGGYSRPPLNMRQPIVTPRSYGGGHSAPSYGGGHSAPSSHGGGGAPHGGGGGSHGGGGGGRHGR